MGKIIETKINRWDGGITNDPRDTSESTARIVTLFDSDSSPHKLSPIRSTESGDSSATTRKLQNFCIGYWSATPSWRLFGLGVVSGTAKASIHMKLISTDSSNDLSDDGWLDPTTAYQTVGTTASMNLFVYYKKTGLFYGARDGSQIWTYNTATSTFSDSAQALTYTNISQGLVHSKDDILYIGYDNKIVSNNNGSWNTTALTLPSHLYVTSICERGNYLAIACAPLAGVGSSVVYLWDRDSTLATLSDSCDWGSGHLKVLEEIGGYLVGISFEGGYPSSRTYDRVIFRYYGSSGAVKFKELDLEAVVEGTNQLPIFKQKIGDRVYFMLRGYFNGALREGVWSLGHKDGKMTLFHERPLSNDTSLTQAVLRGFYIVGEYMFIAYSSGSDVYGLSKTIDSQGAQYSYTASSIYESKKFNTGDSSQKKDLIGVTVATEPLPTYGQVVLKYRTDQNTSWTTIFTEATDNSISHSAVNIESTGATLPKDYKEIQFQIISTGGAEITELAFTEEVTGKRVY